MNPLMMKIKSYNDVELMDHILDMEHLDAPVQAYLLGSLDAGIHRDFEEKHAFDFITLMIKTYEQEVLGG